jgi:hypothetical protein
MRQFTVSAAALMAFAMLSASAPANAEYGPNPTHRNDGKCFTYSRFNVRDGAFGFWSSCEESRKMGCSEAGLTKFGYFGGCDAGAQPASARNTSRRRPRAASR